MCSAIWLTTKTCWSQFDSRTPVAHSIRSKIIIPGSCVAPAGLRESMWSLYALRIAISQTWSSIIFLLRLIFTKFNSRAYHVAGMRFVRVCWLRNIWEHFFQFQSSYLQNDLWGDEDDFFFYVFFFSKMWVYFFRELDFFNIFFDKYPQISSNIPSNILKIA